MEQQLSIFRDTKHRRFHQKRSLCRFTVGHWALRTAVQGHDLTGSQQRVVHYVVHASPCGRSPRHFLVVFTTSHGVYVSKAWAPLCRLLCEERVLAVPSLESGHSAVLMAALKRQYRLPLPFHPFLFYIDVGLAVEWTTSFLHSDLFCAERFVRAWVFFLSRPLLCRLLEQVFSGRQVGTDLQVFMLGLVYQRASASLGAESMLPIAVQATLDMVQLHGPDTSWVNSSCRWGQTLLVLAAPLPRVVKILLDLGADLDLRSPNGSTFLKEVLQRLPGWHPAETIQKLVRISMQRVGTLSPWEDAGVDVLGLLHRKVLKCSQTMSLLRRAGFFTPSLSLIIPDTVRGRARERVRRVAQTPLSFQGVCILSFWRAVRHLGLGRNDVIWSEVQPPGLRKELLLLETWDCEREMGVMRRKT